MDKQHFDHIENRIRQAAERITTPVTEEAWQKMEALLDNQEQKKQRRGIFWWWYLLIFTLVTGWGVWYYFGKQHPGSVKQQQSVLRSGNENSEDEKPPLKPVLEQVERLPSPAESHVVTSRYGKNNVPDAVVSNSKAKVSTQQSAFLTKKQSTPVRNNAPTAGESDGWVSDSHKKAETLTNKRARGLKAYQRDQQHSKARADANQDMGNKIVSTPSTQTGESQNPEPNTSDPDSAVAKSAEPEKKELPVTASKVLEKADKKAAKRSMPVNKPGFYLTASFGEDATSINKISFKTLKPVYGFGIGYRFTNRLSVQSGIHAGGKIYRAGPGDYKLRPSTYVRQIIFVDAECYIYEVPLLIRYDVLAKRKYNVYAAAGLSTYFFKKENYDFHYLNLSGAYRRMPYSYQNNTDYFSVANFSVGIEYKILKRLYIQAEPYMKIPLSGLGEGKVKLTSAGLLAGLRYQPFYTKSKK